GVNQFSANLESKGESYALEESFGDIFGVLVDFATPNTNPNWSLGDDYLGNGQRDFINAKNFWNPTTYGQTCPTCYWVDPSQPGPGGDYGGHNKPTGQD